jgi:hypothetical protein
VTAVDTTTGGDVSRAALAALLFVAMAGPFAYYVVGRRSWGRSRLERRWNAVVLGGMAAVATIALAIGLLMTVFGWVVTSN